MEVFEITRGDTEQINFTFTDGSNSYDLSGKSVTITLKRSLSDTTAALSKDLTITDAVNGLATVTFSSDETSVLSGEYYADIQITAGTNKNSTELFKVRVLKDVTT